jgi:hypothetical protein
MIKFNIELLELVSNTHPSEVGYWNDD